MQSHVGQVETFEDLFDGDDTDLLTALVLQPLNEHRFSGVMLVVGTCNESCEEGWHESYVVDFIKQ